MIRYRACVFAALVLVAATMVSAQPAVKLDRIAVPDLPQTIPLYPAGAMPKAALPEIWDHIVGQINGQDIDERMARNVSMPTISVVLPPVDKRNGAAVLVAPGGAFMSLSMDSEGFVVARRLAERGITAFVLRYRTNPVPENEGAFMQAIGRVMSDAAQPGKVQLITDPLAGKDALQALRLIRERAADWHIDPARVGMIGFSAGAMTTLQAVLTGAPADRPAFIGYIYGPMDAVTVPDQAPPMFAALAMDDPLFGGRGFGIVDAWHAAGRPVELHAYERGNHGFGTGRPGTTTTLVMPEFEAWLEARGLLVRKP